MPTPTSAHQPTQSAGIHGVSYFKLPSRGPAHRAVSGAVAGIVTPTLAPRAIPSLTPQSSAISGATASSRVDSLLESLALSKPRQIDAQSASLHAQRLFAARSQLAGFNHKGKSVQTDLRFLRSRHDNTVTDQLRARLLHAQSELCEQSMALLNRALPDGVAPKNGVGGCLSIEALPLKIQAQLLLACTPSHLLNDAQMRAWRLPSVHELIEIAEGRETQPPAQPWPWRAVHPRLIRAQSDDMLVGKSRYRGSIMGLDADYGRSSEGSESRYTFGTRFERVCKWLSQCVSAAVKCR
ncbi:hypothetical protein [Limnobacter alexandrii]|uniref:hypothetical protein n=1 Tax=Limnobacter alexandrii TaxID=2570352 RepID=UPI001107D6BD|nr:hypothetical protein [Limnobacter alexandrii]